MNALELASYPVEKIEFASGLRYSAKTLSIDEREVTKIALRDPRIKSAELAVVQPGESVRLTGIRDIVEPRIKVNNEAQVFPGVTNPVVAVGEGRTNRLCGMTLVTTAEYEGVIRTGTTAQRSAILDMSGPGAELTTFSQLLHLVLTLRLPPSLPELEAHQAIQRAEYQVAQALAETTVDGHPESIELFDMKPPESKLPRAVLVVGCLTEGEHLPSGVTYYGLPVRESLSTIVHPNELIDGAVTADTVKTVGYRPTTWDWQNHPLSLALMREHGKTFDFAGVVLERIRYETFHQKEVAAHNASQVASSLQADAALVTWIGSGNAFLEVMLTVHALEAKGIRSVLVTYEYGGKYGKDSPLLFYDQAADAVVSTGSMDNSIELPPVQRVVGAYDQLRVINYPGAPYVDAKESITLDAVDVLIGGVDLWGRGQRTCQLY